jgi:lipid II:glycine glycyltransferase (peptidoglycan interpeptide bridge formation enzyme)
MDEAMRKYGGSAILFESALHWAQERGGHCFNFMSSPPDQTSLVRYKEKMGGITRPHLTYELPLSPTRARLFNTAVWAHNLIR